MKCGIRYFKSPGEWRAWLKANHRKAKEIQVGYFKKDSGKPSITWPESVAEALCFGWIDGIRRGVDEERYTIRFTPRRRGSTWSDVNIRMVKALEAGGKMTAAGRAAFEGRVQKKSRVYSYEQGSAELNAARLREFKKNRAAWDFFNAQPASYRKKAVWWVMSAKNEQTRQSRFARLLESAAAGKR